MIDIINKNLDWELRKETIEDKTLYRFNCWKKGEWRFEEFNGVVEYANTADEMANKLITLAEKLKVEIKN